MKKIKLLSYLFAAAILVMSSCEIEEVYPPATPEDADTLATPEVEDDIDDVDDIDEDEQVEKDSIPTHSVLSLQPGPEEGKDAMIEEYPFDNYSTRNFGDTDELSAIAWTAKGTPFTVRSLIDFNLENLPGDAVIDSVKLSLFAYGNAGHGTGHESLTNSNEFLIKRITSEWCENTVTWETQPTTTDENQVLVPESTSTMQDYVIDITDLFKDKRTCSKGLMLQLKTEEHYSMVFFATSDATDESKWPKLDVYYTTYTKAE